MRASAQCSRSLPPHRQPWAVHGRWRRDHGQQRPLTLAGYTISGVSTPESCDQNNPQLGINVMPRFTGVRVNGGTVRGFVDRLLDQCLARRTSLAQTPSWACPTGGLAQDVLSRRLERPLRRQARWCLSHAGLPSKRAIVRGKAPRCRCSCRRPSAHRR
jgi:hypothetical protein